MAGRDRWDGLRPAQGREAPPVPAEAPGSTPGAPLSEPVSAMPLLYCEVLTDHPCDGTFYRAGDPIHLEAGRAERNAARGLVRIIGPATTTQGTVTHLGDEPPRPMTRPDPAVPQTRPAPKPRTRRGR